MAVAASRPWRATITDGRRADSSFYKLFYLQSEMKKSYIGSLHSIETYISILPFIMRSTKQTVRNH